MTILSIDGKPLQAAQDLDTAAERLMEAPTPQAASEAAMALLRHAAGLQREQRRAARAVLSVNDRLLALVIEQAAVLDAVQWASINALGEEACPMCDMPRTEGEHAGDCELYALSEPEHVDQRMAEATR